MFNQNFNNKSNNFFHLREDVTPPSILRANYCLKDVGRGRHTTYPSWQENVGSSSPSTLSSTPALNTQGKYARHFIMIAMIGQYSSSAQ